MWIQAVLFYTEKKPMILLKKVKTSSENYNNELNIPLPKE